MAGRLLHLVSYSVLKIWQLKTFFNQSGLREGFPNFGWIFKLPLAKVFLKSWFSIFFFSRKKEKPGRTSFDETNLFFEKLKEGFVLDCGAFWKI